MQNHKGEIATLLTLGLVLVGTLITLGTSLFVNNQKNIASNPKAQCAGDVPNPDKACCFCKKGKVIVYASSTARVNNCMGTPCTSDAPPKGYGNAYGATNWGYCDSPGGGNYKGGACTGGVDPPSSETPPEGCQNSTCGIKKFGNSDQPVSYYNDKPKEFYFDKDCGGSPVDRTTIMDFEHCGGAAKGDCAETPCNNYYSQLSIKSGFDKNYLKSHSVFTKTNDLNYYDGFPCEDPTNVTTLEASCIPPASAVHTCTITVQCNDILGSDYTGKLFQWSDKQGSSESYYKTKKCLAEANPDEDCVKATIPSSASSFTCPGTETFTSGGATYTSCFKRDLLQTYKPGGWMGDFNDVFKPQCNKCGGLAGIGGNGDDGYCCNPTPQ